MANEEWRSIECYLGDDYEVSNQGSVRRRVTGKRLAPFWYGKHRAVHLCLRGQRKRYYVHQLVADAFMGEPPAGRRPGHRNLDRDDNRAENLEWMTRGESRLHGGISPGSTHHKAKLDEALVSAIIDEFIASDQGVCAFSATKAAAFGVSKHAIYAVLVRRTWQHVACDEDALKAARQSRWHQDKQERRTQRA